MVLGLFSSVKNATKKNKVIANYWAASREDRAGHFSLTVVHEGRVYYFSIWADRSPDLRANSGGEDSVESKMLILENEEDDLFIMGFRAYTYSQYKKEKEQKDVKVPTDAPSILKAKNQMSTDQVSQIKALGRPDQSVTLYSLDTQKILDYFRVLKTQALMWKFWSGRTYPKTGFAQCSSTLVRALIAGGVLNRVENWASYLRKRALMSSAVLAFVLYPTWTLALTITFCSTMLAGALGGAIDVQPISNAFQGVLNVNDRADWHVTKTLISFLLTVCSAISSSFGYDNLVEQFFVLPGAAIHLVEQAALTEEQQFVFSPEEHYETLQFS